MAYLANMTSGSKSLTNAQTFSGDREVRGKVVGLRGSSSLSFSKSLLALLGGRAGLAAGGVLSCDRLLRRLV